MNTFKVVSSNGLRRHVMYVNAIDKFSAETWAMKNNTLLARFNSWYLLYVKPI